MPLCNETEWLGTSQTYQEWLHLNFTFIPGTQSSYTTTIPDPNLLVTIMYLESRGRIFICLQKVKDIDATINLQIFDVYRKLIKAEIFTRCIGQLAIVVGKYLRKLSIKHLLGTVSGRLWVDPLSLFLRLARLHRATMSDKPNMPEIEKLVSRNWRKQKRKRKFSAFQRSNWTGVASGRTVTRRAQPVCTVHSSTFQKLCLLLLLLLAV